MSVRLAVYASVCSALLAASAAVSGAAAATPDSKLVSQAYKALQVGDATTAIQGYTQAIESRTLEPEVLANAFLNRGLSYQKLNEHERAVDDYTAAMRIDAMSAKLRAVALYNRGLSYQRLQRNAMAIEDFTSALFLDGKLSHAYFSRGILLRDGGQYLFALADFDKARRFSYPDAERVHFAEAITYERLRRKNDARNALNQALSVNPNYEPAKQRLAKLDGKPSTGLQVASADQVTTGTVGQVQKKLPLPEAPASDLMASLDTRTKSTAKLFTDRVPVATTPEAKVVPVSAPAPSEEVIVAVEELPPAEESEAQASAEPASESKPAEAVRGWAVQIASAASEDAAWSVWKKMKARHKALGDKDPVVVRADLGKKGVYYRLRFVGFDSQSEAGTECDRLKARGVKCYISKASS